MIHIYCGDGKGKTTAAMGLAVRMAGSGGGVLIGQFFKDGSSSEIPMLRQLPGITVKLCPTAPGRFSRLTETQRVQAREDYSRYLETLLNEASGFDMLVLDEILSACNRQVVSEERLLSFLDSLPEKPEVVLTGRNPSRKLLERGDYVSEIREIQHPFQKGVPARLGIEY